MQIQIGKARATETAVPSVISQTVALARQTLQTAGFDDIEFADGSDESDNAIVTARTRSDTEVDDPDNTTITSRPWSATAAATTAAPAFIGGRQADADSAQQTAKPRLPRKEPGLARSAAVTDLPYEIRPHLHIPDSLIGWGGIQLCPGQRPHHEQKGRT